MIEISEDTIDRVTTILAGVPKGAERALSNAINRGLSKVKTGATKRVKEVYTVKSGALTSATNTRVQRASVGDLTGYIYYSGCKIPLYKFKVTGNSKVHATVKKGGGGTFEDAFIAQMSNGQLGVFERTGEQGIISRLAKAKNQRGTAHTEKVEEKMGLSAVQMIGNEQVITQVEEEAQKTVNERIEHEIDRLLNGYGG